MEFNIIPGFNLTETENEHFYKGLSSCFQPEDVSGRLFRKYRIYKSCYYLEKLRTPELLYPKLFSVDYYADRCRERIMIDLPFTFLNWKIIEEMSSGKMTLEDLDESYIYPLCHTILPGGRTIMQEFSKQGELLKAIYKKVQPNEENRAEMAYEIPFLPDMEGKTTFHYCIEQNEYKTIDDLLEFLKGYGPDHHSRAIVDTLPACLRRNPPNFIPYLNSRLMETFETRLITREALQDKAVPLTVSSYALERSVLDRDLFDQDEQIKKEIKVKFLDIPKVHEYTTTEGEEFFDAL